MSLDTPSSRIKEATPDFAGRIVCVMIAGMPLKDGLYLVDPYFEMQAGRLFLKGNLPETWKHLAGCLTSVAWDQVVAYIVADKMEDFQKARAALEASD